MSKVNNLQRVEREIRDWTARPPARTPRMARQRVLARIEERRPRRRWRLAAATAAVAVVLAFGLLPRGPDTPYEPPVVTGAGPSTSSPGEAGGTGLLVYELESGTKLYMALAVTTAFTKTTMEGN